MATSSKQLPTFPKTAPTFTVTLTFTLLHDFARYKNGKMTIADTSARWKAQPGLPEDGEVGGALGGALYFQIGGRAWVCMPNESAPALVEAERAQYPKLKEGR